VRRFLLVVLAATACANRLPPKDPSLEAVSPSTTIPIAPRPIANARPSPTDTLRVVTFNVHRETPDKVIRGIVGDRALRDADVFVLQEVHRDESVREQCSAACSLASELGFYSVYAPGHAQDRGSDGVAVVSRVPITSAEVIELPYFDVHFNSGRRVALAVTMEIGSTPVTVYAVHLDNRLKVRDRRTQMMPVLEHARRQRTPVIIAGDFNTGPATWISHVVPIVTTTQNNHFERLVRRHGFDTPVVDSGPTHRYLGMKLDAIYTRGFDTLAFATADARNVSDHLALWATLRLRDGSPSASAR
jgi:endonuclease/exonuclease/phosphatase family metal-dependent hydrolase